MYEATSTDSTNMVRWQMVQRPLPRRVFQPGQIAFLYGKVEWDSYASGLAIQPQFEIFPGETEGESSLPVGRVVPIYEAIGKLTPRVLRSLLARLDIPGGFHRCPVDPPRGPGGADGDLAHPLLRRTRIPVKEVRSPSQFRMIFEEFFWLECGLALKRASGAQTGIEFKVTAGPPADQAHAPLHPTAAQKRVLGEIARDMAAPQPMNRLLQGDVGTGKTVVAAQAAVLAIENGYQVAMLAPTEILATQHFLYLKNLFAPLGYHVELLTGSAKAGEKARLKQRVVEGACT